MRHFLPHVVTPNLKDIREAIREVEGFHAKFAVLITRAVGTMACACRFGLIALLSLPDAIRAGRPQIVSWVAQTFLQLVLLSIIMVGQSVQAAASNARAERTFGGYRGDHGPAGRAHGRWHPGGAGPARSARGEAGRATRVTQRT